MAGRWTGGNFYYDPTSLDKIAHTGYNLSAPIPCAYGDTYTLESYVYGPSVRPAVVLNSAGEAVEVLGKPGISTWDKQDTAFTVSEKNAAYICFVCGTGYVSSFRAYRRTVKQLPTAAALKNATGYWHLLAKNRTQTVTDRAQIKCWFKLPASWGEATQFSIPLQLLSADNVAGWTFRAFAATSNSSYEIQLKETAAGYSYPVTRGINVQLSGVPTQTAEGMGITHICLFIDLIAKDAAQRMSAEILPCIMYYAGKTVQAENPMLHGEVYPDILNVVSAGALGESTYGKKLLAMGDSLMSGNTLRKSDTWLNIAAGALDMEHYNASYNGAPISSAAGDDVAGMTTRILSELASVTPDYFVLGGGANDKRLGHTLAAYQDAIRYIIDQVRAVNPQCKILLCTNWRRTEDANVLGLHDSDYVAAMLQVAEEYGIPCVNNYAEGINLNSPALYVWADEGYVTNGERNRHFSKAGNKYTAARYIAEIKKL